jgi:hypothetical protein
VSRPQAWAWHAARRRIAHGHAQQQLCGTVLLAWRAAAQAELRALGEGEARVEALARAAERSDRALLEVIADRFGGGPVGLSTLSVAIGEETDTIEDVLEPYLIQQGFLQRTPRGRVASAAAWRHFGLAAPPRQGAADLFDEGATP